MEDLINKVVDSPAVEEQLDKLYKHLDKVLQHIKTINATGAKMNFKTGFSEAVKAAQEAKAATEELKRAREELRRQEQEIRNAIAQSRLEQQRYKTEVDKVRAAEAAARAEKRRLKEEMKGEAGSILQLRETLKKLREQWDALGPASRKANQQMLRDIKRVDAELKRLEAKTGRYQRNVGNYPRMVGGFTGFLGSFGLTLGAGAIAKAVFDTTVQLDSLDAALKVVTGSEAELAKSQEFLTETADRLGLNIVDLTLSYKNFYAASTQAGLTADQTRAIFNSVSEVAANLKLSQEDVNGVFTAFGQIASKGKVQAEELRGQIGERIPGAFSMAARAIGVTQAELNKMLEQGQVIAVDFLPKFAAELEKTFGVDNETRVEGLRASINRLSNAFADMVSDNQSALSKFFTMIIDLANEALVSINNLLGGIVYVSLKLTDKEAAQDWLNAKAIDEYAAKLKALDEGDILSQRNAVDQRIEMTQHRLEGNLDTIKSIRDAYGKDADLVFGSFLTRIEKVVAEDQAALKLLQLQRKALVSELYKRYPADQAPAESSAAAKEPTKAEQNAARRLRERQRKALLEAAKIDLETAIASQKELLENDKASLQDRLNALGTYLELKDQLSNTERESELKKEGLLAEERIAINKKYDSEEIENKREFWKLYVKVAKDAMDDETKAILTGYQQRADELSGQEDAELKRLTEIYLAGTLSREQFEAAKLQVQNKYANLSLEAEIEAQKRLIAILEKNGAPVESAYKQLYELENKLRDENLKYFEDSEKLKTERLQEEAEKRKKIEQEYANRVKELRQELTETVFSIISGQFEAEKNRVQEQIDLVDERKQKEIEAIESSTASEQEKAAKIAVVNAKAEAQKEALDRKQRQINQQQARFERLQSVSQIIGNTGVAIMKTFADFPYPVALPLSLIIGATGAAQLAQVLATPIPRYFDGTEDHPGGYAIVNDGGRVEPIESPSGQLFVAKGMNALVDLPAHYKVHKSWDDYMAAARIGAYKAVPVADGDGAAGMERLTSHLTKQYEKQTTQLLQGMEKNKSITIIKHTWRGVEVSAQHAGGWTNYMNKNVN